MMNENDTILIEADTKKLIEIRHIAQLAIKSEITIDFAIMQNEDGEKVLFIGRTADNGEKSCYMLSAIDTIRLQNALNEELNAELQ